MGKSNCKMGKLKDYVSIKLKSLKKCVNIGTPPFLLDLWGEKF